MKFLKTCRQVSALVLIAVYLSGTTETHLAIKEAKQKICKARQTSLCGQELENYSIMAINRTIPILLDMYQDIKRLARQYTRKKKFSSKHIYNIKQLTDLREYSTLSGHVTGKSSAMDLAFYTVVFTVQHSYLQWVQDYLNYKETDLKTDFSMTSIMRNSNDVPVLLHHLSIACGTNGIVEQFCNTDNTCIPYIRSGKHYMYALSVLVHAKRNARKVIRILSNFQSSHNGTDCKLTCSKRRNF